MTNTVFSLAGLRRQLLPLRPLAQPFSRSQGLGGLRVVISRVSIIITPIRGLIKLGILGSNVGV